MSRTVLEGEGEEVVAGRLSEGHEEKIFVSVRLRPLNEKEIAWSDVSDWECINENTIIYKNANLSAPERSMYPTAYTYDRVFSNDCSTREVYEKGAKEVALSVVNGINSTVFAYGQTSSGKTYTMTGITEYTIADIYNYIIKHQERVFTLKFSSMEIYNESVRDLLAADGTPLRLLDDPVKGTVVERLTEVLVKDIDHAIELLSFCEAQRQIGETSLNEASSRSHQIIKLAIESSAIEFLVKDNSSTLVASVNFVDLAGSERASQSASTGTRLKEGSHINRSLLTLGTVIRKLSKERHGHIPFRDSKLTRILQSSLGGNARTAIICTMSPARIHVEQSRNTLFFASCAKEVLNNAQVNVVVSDRALVKHLQRELARLESELESSRSNFATSNFGTLLQEKELQIEKLEKDRNYLALKYDASQSQVQDLLHLVRESGISLVKNAGLNHQSNSQVQKLMECDNLVTVVGPKPLSINPKSFRASLCSDGGSRFSSENNIQIRNFKVNFLHNDASHSPLINSSLFNENDSSCGCKEIEHTSQTYDDLCKEVQCIETEINEPTMSLDAANKSGACKDPLPHEDGKLVSPLPKEDKHLALLSVKKEKGLMLVTSEEDKETMLKLWEYTDFSNIRPETPDVVPSPEELSPLHGPRKEAPYLGGSKFLESSCEHSATTTPHSQWLEKTENNESIPPHAFEEHFTRRPEDLRRKLFALNCSFRDGDLSKKSSLSFVDETYDIEVDVRNVNTSKQDNRTSINTCIAESGEKTRFQLDKNAVNDPVKEPEAKDLEPTGTIKHGGSDPIQNGSKCQSNWPCEFKKLRREIIDLWHICNMSLVHRTYFILLFKGDPTDSIYMDVELRRLSFLRDTFSLGGQTSENGWKLTHAASLKALQRERVMFSKQMKKRMSKKERESLYLKWGIKLNSKSRRLQLAYCLWTNTEDIDHIIDSAIVITKLMGFVEPEKAKKEMFSLCFSPRRNQRSFNIVRSFKYLL